MELLVVITIIAILTAAGGPALSALTASGGANQNISQLSGILEQAREYAVAQNTYVWVAFNTSVASNGTKQVSVAVVASTDGTDPATTSGQPSWQTNNYGTIPGTGLALLNKVMTLKQLSFPTAANVANPPALPSISGSPGSINDSTTNGGTGYFSIQVPSGAVQNFIPGIEFIPSGQVRNSSIPVTVIDLYLEPQKGTADDTKNVAVLRMNGLTGETVVYR